MTKTGVLRAGVVAALGVVAGSVGCGSGGGTADGASGMDGSSRRDAAADTDGSRSADAGSSLDAATRTDASTPVDALASTDVATTTDGGGTGTSPTIGGCAMFPANFIFNTPIDTLPVDPHSSDYLTTIGMHDIHLDLGSTVDPASNAYYGIPYNVVHGSAAAWVPVQYSTTDTADLPWDPRPESDCANGSAHTLVSPCVATTAPNPVFPIPSPPLVEGGIDPTPSQPYGDHHVLMVDADTCRLWELYHVYPDPSSGWDIFGSASWDLHSAALRPATWSSADAAGFPMLALLLRGDEASTGAIHHALRFTIQSSKIRNAYVWPARHLTTNGTSSTSLPPMGQLFRIRASYTIPASYSAQSRAILQALKTYGMYLADGGSDLYITGDPSATWADSTFSQVQSVSTAEFEAVDLTPIHGRAGFDPNSGAVPAP